MRLYPHLQELPFKKLLLLIALSLTFTCCNNHTENRQHLSLNGEWEITSSIDTMIPTNYESRIKVPGLLDMANPPFDSAGYNSTKQKYFWYKKTFTPDFGNNEFVYLKIHKAKFGQTVYINGNYVGKYDFCFTPSFYEISKHLKNNTLNEIVVRIGASAESLPDTIPTGLDAEKVVYYPGIYDRVELFSGNYPYIENIQVVPNITKEKILAVIYLENNVDTASYKIEYKINEKKSGNVVASGTANVLHSRQNKNDTLKLDVNIPSSRLWSPENPFLYELIINSKGDTKKVTFGMREFKYDQKSKLALLNGKPYYLRGTNVALHRFFEDTLRHELPWNRKWIEGMHDEFKDMHWNSYRFHVGFAPEDWYEVADEKGFLVQDEYAIWGIWSNKEKKKHKASVLAKEYAVWMKERWNHPSVVIWDAQNETKSKETGKAIEMVRHLDLSDRPWENGYSVPQDPKDVIETHPYMFVKENQGTFSIQPPWRFDSSKVFPHLPEGGWLKNELSISPELFNDVNDKMPSPDGMDYPNAYLINEYGWIWLYRDGTPAWVAEEVWKYYPKLNTPEKRFEWRARVIAAKTEYWRSRREISGIIHFCALTCNRTWGFRSQVSDDWLDVPGLVLQPQFKKYVKPSFAPVGIMIKKWDDKYKIGEELNIPIIMFNDLYEDWNGTVTFKLIRGKEIINSEDKTVNVPSLKNGETEFNITLPEKEGAYEMIAEFNLNGERVFSSRVFKVVK